MERCWKLGHAITTYLLKCAKLKNKKSVLVDYKNVFIHGSGRTIAGVGIEDLIIVDDDNATLIVRKGIPRR